MKIALQADPNAANGNRFDRALARSQVQFEMAKTEEERLQYAPAVRHLKECLTIDAILLADGLNSDLKEAHSEHERTYNPFLVTELLQSGDIHSLGDDYYELGECFTTSTAWRLMGHCDRRCTSTGKARTASASSRLSPTFTWFR